MKTVIYKNLENNLIEDWTVLWQRSEWANYTNSPYWLQSYLEVYPEVDYVIIAIYDAHSLVMVAPLIKVKKYGLQCYTVSPPEFAYGIPFLIDLRNESLVKETTKQLLRLGNIYLINLPEDFIRAFGKYTTTMESAIQTVNYYLPLELENGVTKISNRNKLLREIRGIEDNFTIRSFDGETSDWFTLVMTLDMQSRKHARGYSTFNNKKIVNFYRSLADHFKKHFQCNILYFAEKPIAYEIGFIVGKAYYGSQIAYSTEFKQYSPGKALLVKLIDLLGKRNIERMDFGSGESRLKSMLTKDKRSLYQVIISKNALSRTYLNQVNGIKGKLFLQLQRHGKVYSAFRKVSNMLFIKR